MIRRPPRSTRTDTLFPDTTLFRSVTCGDSPLFHSGGPSGRVEFPGDPSVFDWSLTGLCKSSFATTMRSEEHTSELQSLMRISYAVFCLKKKNKSQHNNRT